MRYHLFIGEGTVRQFYMRLNQINNYLIYFPNIQRHNGNYKQCDALSDDQLCDIINLAKKPKWTLKMMEANVDPYDLDLHDLLDYLERLELVDSLTKKAQQSSQSAQKRQETSKRKPDGSKTYNGNCRAKKPRPQCSICNKFHGGGCWQKKQTNGNNKQQGQANKPFNKTSNNKPSQQRTYTITEMKTIADAFKGMNANPKSGKRKISSRGVNNVSSDKEACTMLRSMSLQHKNSQISSDNTNSDNELTDYRCYSVYDDLHIKIVKNQKGAQNH
jgi:hypothetical protein